MLPVLLAVAAIGTALHMRGGSKLPPGQNPFDSFPVGVDGRNVLQVDQFKATSGHRYKLTTFGSADGRPYVVAEKRGDVDWLSYFVERDGTRKRFAITADKHDELAEMLADFQITEAVS